MRIIYNTLQPLKLTNAALYVFDKGPVYLMTAVRNENTKKSVLEACLSRLLISKCISCSKFYIYELIKIVQNADSPDCFMFCILYV